MNPPGDLWLLAVILAILGLQSIPSFWELNRNQDNISIIPSHPSPILSHAFLAKAKYIKLLSLSHTSFSHKSRVIPVHCNWCKMKRQRRCDDPCSITSFSLIGMMFYHLHIYFLLGMNLILILVCFSQEDEKLFENKDYLMHLLWTSSSGGQSM